MKKKKKLTHCRNSSKISSTIHTEAKLKKNKALAKTKLVSTENLLAEEHKRHSHGIFNVYGVATGV